MALEAVLVTELEPPVPITVADGAGIEKGAILLLSDPNTAALTSGDDDSCAGIAGEEKIASDGKTTLAVYKRGIFRVFIGGTGCTAGNGVVTDTTTGAANELVDATSASTNLVGRALETATDTQSALIELNPMAVNAT
jgi:hypothetical protein